MSEYRELVVTKEDYLVFLAQRLRLQGSCQREIENVSFPFLFASGSEMLRTYIMGTSEFTTTLPDRYRLPDRGFIWYLFTQSVREIQVMPDKMVIKYELQDEYKKPFKQFYSSDVNRSCSRPTRCLSGVPPGPSCPGTPLRHLPEARAAFPPGAFPAGA